MANLPIPLNSNERVLLDSEAVYPRTSLLGLGYNAIFGHLWLTDQRLIFRDALMGQILALPLGRVTGAEASDRQIRTKGARGAKPEGFAAFMTTSTLMMISFDSGGREYFAVKDIAGWTAAIVRARPEAPPMEYTWMPSSRPGVEMDAKDLVLWFGGAVSMLCLGAACCGGLTLGLPFILAFVDAFISSQ